MTETQNQNYRNHGRVVPVYHIGVFFILLVNFVWAGYRVLQGPSGDSLVTWLTSIGLILMFFSVRAQILTVQDRVIRVEMRLRLRALLTPDAAARAAALPVKQLVALRFAGDAELPSLVEEVLAGRLVSQKDIKTRVQDWQADFLRA
ncbi:MAG: DUF6526 family protein [Vicinamibacterales bacterium]